MSVALYRYTDQCEEKPCPMNCDRCGREDDFYWELLEEQHAHDVVMVGAEGGEEDERSD